MAEKSSFDARLGGVVAVAVAALVDPFSDAIVNGRQRLPHRSD